MKKILVCILAFLFVAGTAVPVFCGTEDTSLLTIQVQSISELSVSGAPSNLAVSSAVAGSQPVQVADNSTTYSVSTNGTNKIITGQLNADMPTGVTLYVNLAAPTGASSAGDVPLTNLAQNLVTGITGLAASSKIITYKFSANVTAGTMGLSSRTLTFTLTD
ncbi:MAG: hypothetical protein ABIH00_00065 [Armatimonadota bacterium]